MKSKGRNIREKVKRRAVKETIIDFEKDSKEMEVTEN